MSLAKVEMKHSTNSILFVCLFLLFYSLKGNKKQTHNRETLKCSI